MLNTPDSMGAMTSLTEILVALEVLLTVKDDATRLRRQFGVDGRPVTIK